ncbi:Nuclear mitotic apparatus protein 1 [Bagarius yarrelli]|uniref:Nuclear mitotic apparatus protein 1 n=1 Tax=Bagarius yarrelli TaxID=175774 RepID=A0A556TTS3_BAGYA|nr:Nuclear mitotic apparatus protein 1 [Bagarius yarrelli]
MFAELETLSQELRKLKHQKLDAEACIEKLAQEGVDLKATLVQEREHSQTQFDLVNKAKEEKETELQQMITANQSKIAELQCKIEETVESLKQSESELSALKSKIISKDGELGKQQQELAHLQNKADNLQRQLMEVEGRSRQLSEDVVSKNKEVQHLKVELEQKEGEIRSLKVNLQTLEAKSGEMSDFHQKEIEKQIIAVTELRLQLAECEKIISEKVKSLEDLAQQVKVLKEELSSERQKVATLELSFKASEEAHEAQEQTLRLEITQLQQEIDGHLNKLEKSLNEGHFLREEMSRQQDVALQKEREFSVVAEKNKSLEKDFAELQNKLAEATTLATERQAELLKLQEEVQHQENLRAETQKFEETRYKELQKEATELQAKVQELTVLASEREIQLGSLHEKMKEMEDQNQKRHNQSEEALQKELANVVDLMGQLESAKHQTAATKELLESTEEKLKQTELMYQQKDVLAREACQSKEALERTVNELCSKQKQDLDRYQQDLESLKKEKEHLTSVNESLQNECQTLQVESKEQQETLNAFKADLQSTKSVCEQDLEALKKEKEHFQDECQSLQTENKKQYQALNSLKADLQKTQEVFQKDLEIIKKENEHLSSVNRSLQIECQDLQKENKGQHEVIDNLKADHQNGQIGHQREVETLKKELEHFSSVNQSLQSECQNFEAENKKQQEELHVLKVDLQTAQEVYQQELGTLRKDKDHLTSMHQALEAESQNMQTEREKKMEELNILKADLQNVRTECQQEIDSLKNDKEHLTSVTFSLRTECQTLQAEKTKQQEALNTLKGDLQECKDEYEKDLKILKNEKEELFAMNQTLQTEVQILNVENKKQLDILTSLRADLQNAQHGYQKELEILKKDQEHLHSVNQSLQNELKNLQEEKTGQQQELNAFRADLQESKTDLEALRNEKEKLALVNQDLHAEKMGQQEELNALKTHLQENKDKFNKDMETLTNEKEQLASVNQSLLVDLEAAQKLASEMASVKGVTLQRQNELEGQVMELQVNIKEFSTLADEREAELKNLHLELKQQEALRLGTEDSEKALKAELETKVAQLQIQVEEACKHSSESKSELSLLQDQYKESEKQKQEACEANRILENTVSEQKQKIEEYHQQLEALASVNQALQAEKKTQQEILNDLQSGLQQEVKTLRKEKEHLSSLNQSLQRERDASQRLGEELEAKLKGQAESFQARKEAFQKKEQQNQELLKLKTEAVEHYKVQVEKAKTHYNGKKQQLLEEQEARQALQANLETSESEAKALKAELKLVSMELEKIKASEKRLMVQIKSLETQLDYADRQLREQRKQEGPSVQMKHRESVYSKIPENPRNTSSDSLELDLDDSLNAAGKCSLPGESSTPLVRSSERLAAKRRAKDGGSLETLYFTPMMPRGNRASQAHKLESSITSLGELTLDSTKKPSSSVRRRRTTQVINITMTKKTPLGSSGGAADADESFFSLQSASSQPNLASHKARPVSAEIFDDSSKLLSLPGYRRSNAHAATSAFCIGAENEPDHIGDDWMRIAELQSRNKSCLPHLKSSYPLESRPSLGFSHLPVTDEDVRTGDPTETIRRVSMLPSQLKDATHRLSLAPPAPASHSHVPVQRAPQVAKARDVRSTRSPLAPKRPAGQVQDLDTPEVKKPAGCFPRTPKGRNLRSTNSQNVAPTPADRKQSTAFMIDNTPRKTGRGDSRLQRGISKLRKSPRTISTKSPKITSSAKKAMLNTLRILNTLELQCLVRSLRSLCGDQLNFCQLEQEGEMDVLDVVDRMLEKWNEGEALDITVRALYDICKGDLAASLEHVCRKALVQFKLRVSHKRRYYSLYEGTCRPGKQRYIRHVYVESPIVLKTPGSEETPVRICDLFSPLRAEDSVRVVVTTGVPAIGLTVAVQMFLIDWMEQQACQNFQFVFALPGRDLHLVKNSDQTFLEFLAAFYPEAKQAEFLACPDCPVLFVIDALELCKQPLNFQNNPRVTDVTTPTPVDALLTSLIAGDLLPHACVWITAHQAACRKIPKNYIGRFTQLKGFGDTQKNEYFTKRTINPTLGNHVLDQVRASQRLYDACYLPLFCWIVSVVYERCLQNQVSAEQVPTLTTFYVQYVIVLTNRKIERYVGTGINGLRWKDADRNFLMKMGELALRNLCENETVFYEDSVSRLALDIDDVTHQGGISFETDESTRENRRSFRFVHPSVQTFMAALYVYVRFRLTGENAFEPQTGRTRTERPISELYKPVIDRVLRCSDPNMDLFLHFLLGLSARKTEMHLRGHLLPQHHPEPRGIQEVLKYGRKRIKQNAVTEPCGHLEMCLSELEEGRQ